MKKILFAWGLWGGLSLVESIIYTLEGKNRTLSHVTGAESTGEAIEALKEERFDWVVINAQMRGKMNGGKELADHIFKKYPEQRVLVVSRMSSHKTYYEERGCRFLCSDSNDSGKEMIKILRG